MRRLAMQRGATLIVVLIMLVLLTLVGTWAIRGSLTSLNIAMNTQAQALLQQASDAVFFNLENQTSDELTLAKMQIGDGMLAYVLRPENKGKELVFCIRGGDANSLSGSRNASVVYWEGSQIKNTQLGTVGFCNVDQKADFISGRSAVMTRVGIRAASNSQDWEHLLEGDDSEMSKTQKIQKVVVNVTSIIPNLSSNSSSDIQACLSNYTSFVDSTVTNNETVSDCLKTNNVPYSNQEMEYTLKPVTGAS
ncbi:MULTISPECIES: pilus assembly PilX family protein [unclassified Acinetobacter]|uniref:pilus assembly PilX family protein n=1 Tax=unclassified Acinetobacter TaxID=196816 RepID=UPI0022AC2080|nr:MULTISPECIES: PilX N-terminal domain-containing pilus assembly protein [unclassified Acinetobacter]WAU73850.1 PilX N-terminal domain-containing pilus assembly protein [Acinetobacter sp. TR11]WAU76377.1 PilX N-terminal domain-containing pilus assembly protein [Acinetobacter sp. TR3]